MLITKTRIYRRQFGWLFWNSTVTKNCLLGSVAVVTSDLHGDRDRGKSLWAGLVNDSHFAHPEAGRGKAARKPPLAFIQIHPYYRMADGKKVFTDEDIARLIDALPRPQNPLLIARERASTTRYASPANEIELAEALRLVRERLRSPRTKKRPWSAKLSVKSAFCPAISWIIHV
jgi:hypothetical protein